MKRLLCIFIFACSKLSAQSFYDLNTIQKIEVYFAQPNWDYQLDTSKYGADGYVVAAPLKSPATSMYCVDSNGTSKEYASFTATLAAAAPLGPRCP